MKNSYFYCGYFKKETRSNGSIRYYCLEGVSSTFRNNPWIPKQARELAIPLHQEFLKRNYIYE